LRSGLVSLRPLYEFLQADPEAGDWIGGHRYGVSTGPSRRRSVRRSLPARFLPLGTVRAKWALAEPLPRQSRIRKDGPPPRTDLGGAEGRTGLHLAGVRLRENAQSRRETEPPRDVARLREEHDEGSEEGRYNAHRLGRRPELPEAAVRNIESDLIETFNPAANISRPVPPVSLQQHTKEIIAEFRSQIHGHRGERYRLRG